MENKVDYVQIFKNVLLNATDIKSTFFPRDPKNMSAEEELFMGLKMLILKLEEHITTHDQQKSKDSRDDQAIHLQMFETNAENQESQGFYKANGYWSFIGDKFMKALLPVTLYDKMYPKRLGLKKNEEECCKNTLQTTNSAGKPTLTKNRNFDYLGLGGFDNLGSGSDLNQFKKTVPRKSKISDTIELSNSKDKKDMCLKLLGKRNSVISVNKATEVPVRTIYKWRKRLLNPKGKLKLTLQDEDIDTSIRNLMVKYNCTLNKAFRAKRELQDRIK